MGDTKARLGSFLCDKDIHGNYVTNPNSPLLSEFLDFSGLIILNKIFCLAIPTYEIVNRKKSIIDMSFTNSLDSVADFSIEQTPLGGNSQTCHKPLILSISLDPPIRKTDPKIKPGKRLVFGSASLINRKQMAKFVSSQISSFCKNGLSADYELLKKVFLTAKKRYQF